MTNSFSNLLLGRPDLGHVERQRASEAEFPSLIEKSHMRMWRLGEESPPAGEQVIWIGVGTFSVYDMELLDKLEAKLSRETVKELIYVSDTVAFPEFNFEERLPGIGRVFDVPIVGYWKEGVLEVKLSSAKARDWLMERFELPPLSSIQRFQRQSRGGISDHIRGEH